MLDSLVVRALRRWARRWWYRLRVICSFPTLWRQFCGNCAARRWIVGNDDWYALCMGCLTGYSRTALLEWGPGRDRMYDSQQCARGTDLGRLGRQLCKEKEEGAHSMDDETSGEGASGPMIDRQHDQRPDRLGG